MVYMNNTLLINHKHKTKMIRSPWTRWPQGREHTAFIHPLPRMLAITGLSLMSIGRVTASLSSIMTKISNASMVVISSSQKMTTPLFNGLDVARRRKQNDPPH